MDFDETSRRESAGAHSVRSQLIVVSPRIDNDSDGDSGSDSRLRDSAVFRNPIVDDSGTVVVSVEVTNNEGQEQLPLVKVSGNVRPSTTPSTSLQPRSGEIVRPSTTPSSLPIRKDEPARTDGYQSLDEDGERAMSPMSPIDEHVLEDVLYNRPSLRLGRELSMRFRAQTAIPSRRRRRVYQSLPHGAKRPKTTTAVSEQTSGEQVRLRRVSSLPNVNSGDVSAITLEDLRDIMNVQSPSTLRREEDLRRSTRRLKERIQLHHYQEQERSMVAQENVFANFYYVKWPKIKSRLRVAASYRLWNGHMKEVEGHFGTAVVSYFIYLRWLFIMNLVIFAIWFGLVVIPNVVYVAVEDPPRTPSQLSCVYPFSISSTVSCSDDNSTFDSNNLFYIISGGGTPQYTCTLPSNLTSFSLRLCDTESGSINGVIRDIAVKESSASAVTVSNVMPNPANCTLVGDSGGGGGGVLIQQVRLCSNDIAPNILWYQYIIDFVLGQGVFNETVLFYGRYSNATIGLYNLPVTYLIVTGIVYTISVVLLVFKMGQAYNESYVEVGKSKSVNFCNKLFTAWDFNITSSDTAKLRRAQIRTDFEEEIADYERRNTKRTWKELAIVITIRIFTNLLTFIVLLGGAVTIFYSTAFGLQNQSSGTINFEGLVTPVVITTLNLILPFLFSFLARFERFKTQSGEIKMTLLRAILVRLASLFVLIATIYILIRCTQEVTEETSSSSTTVCSFSSINLNSLLQSDENSTSDPSTNDECPVCWETFIGQEFYKLGLTNFAVSAASTIAVETFRNIVSRVKYKGLGQKIGKGNFNIPKSILDLIYTQSLLWLGFFFCPMLPAVILITSFVLFYIKKYSLIFNLEPDKRGATKTARNNFHYLFLILATLGLYLIIVGVAIGSFRPSSNCGPFRGNDSFFTAVSVWINTFSCVAQQALDFFATATFVIPLIAVLLLVVYAQYVLLRSRKDKFELVKKQLILEGANVTHIVGKLDNVLQKVADHRQEVMNTIVLSSPHDAQPSPSSVGYQRQRSSVDASHQRQRSSLDVSGQYMAMTHPTPLKERIQKMRESISDQEAQVSYQRSPSQDRDVLRQRTSLASTGGSSGEHAHHRHSSHSSTEEQSRVTLESSM